MPGVTGARIVKVAHEYVGRTESPVGSNTGPFVLQCQRATFLAGTRWPWCAAFIAFVAEQCGVKLGYPSAGAHDLADHYVRAGYSVTLADAKPGDIVDLNIGSGHTAIIVSHDRTHGVLHTIDGNWNDRVSEVEHPVSQVRHIWRIPGVSVAQPPVHTPKFPPFVVATSASGHRKILFRARRKKRLLSWLGVHNLALLAPNGITITRRKKR